MGTAVTFDLRPDQGTRLNARAAERAVRRCTRWLHWVDETFTTYSEDSWVRRLARHEVGVAECPGEVEDVIRLCEEFREETDGWFDPWAGPAGFDPSGLVKGWAAQAASELLLEAGFPNHCVNAGGDVAARGAPTGESDSWGVGIAHPLVPRALCAVVSASEEAVATSGTAERGKHVWDPKRRRPADQLASVTVVHPDLTTADVYATAAFAMGVRAADWLQERERTDAYIVDSSGKEWSSPGFARRRTWPSMT